MADGREMAEAYARVRQRPVDGSLAAAIRVHAQACGLVAFVLGVHPDVVARAVAVDRELSRSVPRGV